MQIESAFPEDLARRLDEILEETGDSRIEEIRDEFQALLIASRAARSGRPARGGSGRRRVTGSEAPEATARSKAANRATIEAFRDKMSTRLMEAYRTAGSTAAFGLLYEVNCRLFLNVISSRLRKFYFPLDPQDVLQEVFFNIYRYPHKFQADKDQAFRHWASMIIRNTVYKCTRERDREITHELQDDEIEARADRYSRTPLGDAIRVESRDFCSRAYLLFLHLYLSAYQQLSSRERQALHMVEVDGTLILLVRQGGLFAMQGTCSHEYFELDKGFLTADSVTCALHLSRFDLTDGEPLEPPAELPLVVYSVSEVDGDIVLELPEDEVPVNE
ncbi:MAG: Rieske 2Fe-2S domain-containing protein [Planctomycetota bacterium]